MMKGNNELRINRETMVQALQLWIDTCMKTPLTVYGVTVEGNAFVVLLKDKAQETGGGK
jgi:hypothetical protein